VGGSFHVTFKLTNRAEKQVSKPCLFSFCLALISSLEAVEFKKKKKNKVAAPSLQQPQHRCSISAATRNTSSAAATSAALP